MAKRRFPSPANVEVTKDGIPAELNEQPEEMNSVEAKPVTLVQVLSTADHMIVLDHVHHLSPGVNQVHTEVWESAKTSPHLIALMEAGKVTVLDSEEA